MRVIGWVQLLWAAMSATGKGYKRDTLKNRPPKGAAKWRGERRKDKIERADKEALQPIVTGKINFRRSPAGRAILEAGAK